jgi:hypothetical protein
MNHQQHALVVRAIEPCVGTERESAIATTTVAIETGDGPNFDLESYVSSNCYSYCSLYCSEWLSSSWWKE